MKRLGINIDHVATVRNARGSSHPDPVSIAEHIMECGAHSITIHLREDRRHIGDLDVVKICKNKKIITNLEISLNEDVLRIALINKLVLIFFFLNFFIIFLILLRFFDKFKPPSVVTSFLFSGTMQIKLGLFFSAIFNISSFNEISKLVIIFLFLQILKTSRSLMCLLSSLR